MNYWIKRILQAILTLFLASALSFAIIQLSPGDYLNTLQQNPTISAETIEALRQQFGLDKPPVEQYFLWLSQVLRGNFGESFVFRRPVALLLWERVPATLLLALASLILTWGLAIPLGIVAAVHQNRRLDYFLQGISYLAQGFPSFIAGLILLFIAQRTGWFPVGDMTRIDFVDLTPLGKVLDILWHLFLPALTLTIISFAGLQRLMRGNLLDVLGQDYIRTARAKGLPESRVIYIHALRNAINPMITLLGFEFATLLSGAFISEYFFNWPGLGRLILQAVTAQDLYLVMASLMLGSVMLIVGNLLADILLQWADPRIQFQSEP
ncbi:MAG: ABC transporter permease [Gloeomargarita sp. HHBFW_bins_162]